MFMIIYRTGGYLNAVWRPVLDRFKTREDAAPKVAELERMGYLAMVKPTREIDVIGLPVGYCSQCDPVTGECRKRREECRKACEAINA